MTKKTILLIEDDPETEATLREVLAKEYDLEIALDGKTAAAFLEKKTPDLLIIDFDLKGKDGLQVYKELQPSAKVIMLSFSGSIPLAVSATKLGVAEFLPKPINAKQLESAVKKYIAREVARLQWVEGMEWLRGESPKLKEMFAKIQEALEETRDVILIGERGIPKEKVVEFLHANSPNKKRKLQKVDLASFGREAVEPHFWGAIREFMAMPEEATLQNEEDRCGTLYLEKVEDLDEQFKLSIFNFFKERKGRIDKRVRVVIGIYDRSKIPKLEIKDYVCIEIPPLRERKEDLPYLLGLYLKRYSTEYDKQVKFVSSEILDFLAAYDYPGNYLELEKIIQAAVLAATSEKLELKHFPLEFRLLLQSSLKQTLGENLTLESAKRRFEKSLYQVLLEKADRDISQVARFLDLPKTTLAGRLEDLLG